MAGQTMGQIYRSYAAREMGYAAEATVAHVKAIHLSSAKKWIGLAERSERFVKPT